MHFPTGERGNRAHPPEAFNNVVHILYSYLCVGVASKHACKFTKVSTTYTSRTSKVMQDGEVGVGGGGVEVETQVAAEQQKPGGRTGAEGDKRVE